MNAPIDPNQRRREIVNLVMARKSVSVENLVAALKVSRMTIHRDLDLLEERGLLRKQRGGATAESSLLFESNIHYRLQNENAEKQALAHAARRLIEPGSVIMIDDSTTTLMLAEELASIEFVTVITNSLAVCERLRGRRNVQLILTGGSYNETLQAFYGLICEAEPGQAARGLGLPVGVLGDRAVALPPGPGSGAHEAGADGGGRTHRTAADRLQVQGARAQPFRRTG